MFRTGLVTDSRLKLHTPGIHHPEQPDRLTAVLTQLDRSGLASELTQIAAVPATDDQLQRVHTHSYIQLVSREAAEGFPQLSTGDTQISDMTPEVARLAAGCAIAAIDAVFQGHVHNAFCAIRPPGHHASQSTGMGFCVYNHVAVAARHSQSAHNAETVAIIDWDVHHGNGTQDVFYDDPSVLFFSTHQSPWYPGTGAASETGAGPGEGKTINCPLPAGSGRDAVLAAVRDRFLPALERHRPDLILISAGFDSRMGDPLGQFILRDSDFRELTTIVMEAADKFCAGRLVSILEGGYSLEGLAMATETHVRALAGHV